jgi:hypothetical protein
MPEAQRFVDELVEFVHTEPKLPLPQKDYLPTPTIEIGVDWTRDRIIEYLQDLRNSSVTADLAFYACRDMETCDWVPFVKAAVERSPVSLAMTEAMSLDEVSGWLKKMDNASIYDGKRLAQPDEVANYRTGDGLEKAILLANIIRQKLPQQDIEIIVDKSNVVLNAAGEYHFASSKELTKKIRISSAGDITVSV